MKLSRKTRLTSNMNVAEDASLVDKPLVTVITKVGDKEINFQIAVNGEKHLEEYDTWKGIMTCACDHAYFTMYPPKLDE